MAVNKTVGGHIRSMGKGEGIKNVGGGGGGTVWVLNKQTTGTTEKSIFEGGFSPRNRDGLNRVPGTEVNQKEGGGDC